MIMNNGNKKLSRNKKKKTQPKKAMDLLLNKIKLQKNKADQLENQLVRIKYKNEVDKDLNKIHVIDKNLHEIKIELLQDYEGVIELIGNLKVGDQTRQTHIRFRNMSHFETHINIIDVDYDADDCIFKGYNYKIDTPIFNKVKKSQYRKGCSFDKTILDYCGNNCFIPSKGYCFVKCINFLTDQDYNDKYLDFIRSEQRRSNIMTKARIQPCLRKLGIDLGYYNGDRVFPRAVTNRDSALYLYINHFCSIWKSHDVSFNQAIQELKNNFKMVGNYITEKNVNSHFEYIYRPKQIKSHLTIFIVYDLETHNTARARPYVFSFYRLSKLARKYDRDLTRYELQKCRNDTIAFDGDNCVEKALDFCLELKREEYKDK